jgi:WD repeat and SOF domain-containing protein 1
MKVKVIARTEESSTRGTAREKHRVYKNPDPLLHPFERAREYTRAVRAAKMERMFAKPFVGAMDDHSDAVHCCSTSPASLSSFVSGAADGEVIVWDLPTRLKLWSVYAHTGFVKGVAITRDGGSFFSVGMDKTIKQWRMAAVEALANVGGRGGGGSGSGSGSGSGAPAVAPLRVWGGGKTPYFGVDTHWREPSRFATASSSSVELWDAERGEPTATYVWGCDTVTSVRWNPGETSLLAATSGDRGVSLYDARQAVPLRKATLAMSCNAVAWNPREPLNFTAACEDSCAYTFDMRRLERALGVHKGHAGAVMDVHYAPTGREFVTGSYDKSVRIWPSVGAGSATHGGGGGTFDVTPPGRSRDIYHTSRMQRVFAVRFTPDARFILTASDDANVRVWKARASEALGRALPRERAAADYRGALARKFGHMPEVKRIATQRNIPGMIRSAGVKTDMEERKARRKLANVRAHSKPGTLLESAKATERKRSILRVQ